MDDVLGQREPRDELVGRVGEAVHAISPRPGQVGVIWDRGEERIKSQSGQKPTLLLLLLPFHHLLVAAGLYSQVALQLPLVVTNGLGTGSTVLLGVIWNKALLASLQKLNSQHQPCSCSSERILWMLPALLPGGGQR